jgi:hypothetical protein
MACDNCKCTCPLKAGDPIRHTKTFHDGVRLGGLDPKYITYISKAWVGYEVYSPRGTSLGEYMIERQEFDKEFERDPTRQPRLRSF